MKAWYFSSEDRKLRYGDNRIIKAGLTHKVTCKPVLCESGLHGSKKILDALSYAPGPIVWRVELGGDVDIGDDKISATERHYLWGYDATDVLRRFARRCALDVIHLWDAPDVVIQYLKTGNDDLMGAAYYAAYSAAYSATYSAADSAAYSAARKKQNNRLTSMVMAARRK